MTHNKMPKDTVEEVLKEKFDWFLDTEVHFRNFNGQMAVMNVKTFEETLRKAFTTAYNKGVEEGREEERNSYENFCIKHGLNPNVSADTPLLDSISPDDKI